jgi:hypothetical protein
MNDTDHCANETHCPYCALQCGMRLVAEDGRLVVAPRDFPTNKGGLCRKGFTAAELLDARDRLTAPLVRANKGGALLPVSWDEALDRIAAGLQAIQAASGPDAIGVFGGGGLTNEKAYMLGKFARVALRTANIDYNGRFCMATAAAAGLRAFGIDRGLPFPLEDIPGAEGVLLVGGNPADTMPPLMQYFAPARRQAHRGRSPPVGDRQARFAAPAGHSRDRRGARQRALERGDRAPADRRRLHRRAHQRIRCGPPHRRVLLARSRRAHHRRAGAQDRRGCAHHGGGGHRGLRRIDVLPGASPIAGRRRGQQAHAHLHLGRHGVAAHDGAAVAQAAGLALDHEQPQGVAGFGHQHGPALAVLLGRRRR